MERSIVMRGRLLGRHIELDEAVSELDGEVEVEVRAVDPSRRSSEESLLDFIRRLPPGTRTKEDIDRELLEERNSWGEG